MFQQKSVAELQKLLQSLSSELSRYDQSPARDKKKDYRLLPSSSLKTVLRSDIPAQEKKKVLLNQIGLLRINLFAECSGRVENLEQNNDLDKATEVMNDYLSKCVIPFIPSKKQPSLINRLMDLISRERLLEPFEYLERWKTGYQAWFERGPLELTGTCLAIQKRERFEELKVTFHMLYTYSFSDDNFPPSSTIIFVGQT